MDVLYYLSVVLFLIMIIKCDSLSNLVRPQSIAERRRFQAVISIKRQLLDFCEFRKLST